MAATRLVILASAAALALAAAVSTLSPSCQSAVNALNQNADVATCLDVAGVQAYLATPPTSSLVQPFDAFLRGYCPRPACSSATVNTIVSSLESGCAVNSAAASSIGGVPTAVQSILLITQNVMCLADSGTQTYCFTEILTELENELGGKPLTAANAATLPKLNKTIDCTPCSQALLTAILAADPNDSALTSVVGPVKAECGANFFDVTGLPAGIVEAVGPQALSSANVPTGSGASSANSPSGGEASSGNSSPGKASGSTFGGDSSSGESPSGVGAAAPTQNSKNAVGKSYTSRAPALAIAVMLSLIL